MPELPEIANLARQLNERLAGKQFAAVEVIQPKCLNMPPEEFRAALSGAVVDSARHHGKWILVHTDRGWLLINLGMGGELLLVSREQLPEKRRLVFEFTDASALAVNFWWFGYAHYAPEDGLAAHPMVGKLGPNALDLDAGAFAALAAAQRGRVKDFLLDQSKLAGIGNAYVHDILWLARLHPLRKVNSLTTEEIGALHRAIGDGLRPSLEKGGAFYEMDTYGQKGGFTFDEIRVGYKEGKLCPACGTPIEKLKTGSTSSFICPSCQKI